MSFIYITEPSASLKFEEGRVVVQKQSGENKKIPIETIDGIITLGISAISSKCIIELLKKDIPVTFLSMYGHYHGRLETTKHMNSERQGLQFARRHDGVFCYELARKIVEGKINNQIVMLRRYNRHNKSEITEKRIKQIEALRSNIGRAGSIERLLGYEGYASKLYFSAISDMIDYEFKFKGRNRMPSKDPFNSVLNFGYTLLFYEIYTVLVNKGLNPYAGFMHKDKAGHPALASDLIEQWRTILIDSTAMSLIQGREILVEDFISDENGGVFMKKDAIQLFVRKYQNKLDAKTDYLSNGTESGFRNAIINQVDKLILAISTGEPEAFISTILR